VKTNNNISKNKRIEENNTLNQVLNSLSDGVCVIDNDFNIMYINDTLLNQVDSSKKLIIEKKCFDVFNCSLCNTEYCPIVNVQSDDEPFLTVVKTNMKQYQKSYLVSSKKFLDANGIPIGVIIEFKDITESESMRQKIEIENQALEVTLSSVFDVLKKIASSVPFVHLDTSSELELVPKLKELVYAATKEMENILELSHEFARAISDHFDILNSVAGGDIKKQVLGKAKNDLIISLSSLSNQMIESAEQEIHNRKLAEDQLISLKKEFEQSGYQTTFELEKKNKELKDEIRYRKNIEYELIKAKQLAEKANKFKNQFLSNISHEIRTPINGIFGMVDLALRANPDKTIRNYLEIINSESTSLLGIINDILDFSKIEAGKLDIDKILFDLKYLMNNLIRGFSYRAESKGLRFVSYLSPDLPVKLIGDPGRLRQIINNLAENALKFTHEGEIFIKCELMEIENNIIHIKFTVQDTGIGIPKDKHKTIFEGFKQVDGSTTRKYGGTGLGITIAKQLVELMDGSIQLESEEGKGATFWFTIPFPQPDINKTELSDYFDHSVTVTQSLQNSDTKDDLETKHTMNETISNDCKILLVEDYPTTQQIVMTYLQLDGFTVDLVPNGKKAVEAFKNNTYDIILMDIQMPEMDGFEATKKIREIEQNVSGKYIKTPIIAMTAHAIKGFKDKCIQAGIDDYISKPMQKNDLTAIVNKWIKSIDINTFPPKIEQRTSKRNINAEKNNIDSENQERYPIHISRAIEEFEGNKDIFLYVLVDFLKRLDNHLISIKEAIRDDNCNVIKDEAHSIKGAAGNLTAFKLSRVALELERIGKSGNLKDACQLYDQFKQEVENLKQFCKKELDI